MSGGHSKASRTTPVGVKRRCLNIQGTCFNKSRRDRDWKERDPPDRGRRGGLGGRVSQHIRERGLTSHEVTATGRSEIPLTGGAGG